MIIHNEIKILTVTKMILCTMVLFLFFFSNLIHATHKAWLLKNSGAQCVKYSPNANDFYPGIVENQDSGGFWITCSVTLSSLGGSSDNGVSSKYWLAAKQARIFVKGGVDSAIWCQARAKDLYGNVFFGAGHHYTTDEGIQVLDLIERERDWGGTLETVESRNFTQLDFECFLGGGSSSAPVKLIGYDVAICQNRKNCEAVRKHSPGSRSHIQGNGIECFASTPEGGRFLRRSEFGFTNQSSRTLSAHCPVTQPTDDSYEHNRSIYTFEVIYTGRRPTCNLESYDEEGNLQSSPAFEAHRLDVNALELQRSYSVGDEKSIALKCDLPPNTTIEGYKSEMSVTQKSGGI